MNIVNWTPFHEMDDMFSRFRRLSGTPATTGNGDVSGVKAWRPVADISESDKEYVIKAELPDVERKDIHVSVEGNAVTISGERKMDKETEDSKQHRIESFYGTFSRSFLLPDNAAVGDISAKSKRGVLKVRIPKVEEMPAKKIQVDVD